MTDSVYNEFYQLNNTTHETRDSTFGKKSTLTYTECMTTWYHQGPQCIIGTGQSREGSR